MGLPLKPPAKPGDPTDPNAQQPNAQPQPTTGQSPYPVPAAPPAAADYAARGTTPGYDYGARMGFWDNNVAPNAGARGLAITQGPGPAMGQMGGFAPPNPGQVEPVFPPAHLIPGGQGGIPPGMTQGAMPQMAPADLQRMALLRMLGG